MIRDLAISCEQIDCDPLLCNWRWLIPKEAVPLMIGIFGDLIFAMSDGSFWLLDLLEGDFRQIASNAEDFNRLKDTEESRDSWFSAGWANIALQHGLVPKDDECLGWKVLPILGGSFSLDNIQVYSLAACHAIHGQLFEQIAAE